MHATPEPARASTSPIRWWPIVAIWTGIGLFDATQNVVVMRAEGMQHAWTQLFALLSLAWLPWAIATPVVLRTASRYPFVGEGAAVGWMRHVLLWASIALTASAWMAALQIVLNPWTPDLPPPPFEHLWGRKITEQVLSSLLLYYCIAVAGALLASRDRAARQRTAAAELAEQLSKAQLDALRNQIEPHFLFNALNAVTGLIREQRNDLAIETIARIGAFLRHVLDDATRQTVTLGVEATFAAMYLDIQKVRFDDRLRFRIDIPADLEGALVPGLILQPIVENAVKHGIAMRVRPGIIEITAARHDDGLVLAVYNDGPSIPLERESGDSVGLTNVRARLLRLYGSQASLTLVDVPDRGVCATLCMPWHEG